MTFKEQLETDQAVFFNSDEFAEAAVYRPLVGFTVSCNVLIDFDAVLQPDGYEVSIVETGITLEARYIDVGEPEQGETFVVGSTTYTVAKIEDNDRVWVKMVVNES